MNIKEAKYYKHNITKENDGIFVTLNDSDVSMSIPLKESNAEYRPVEPLASLLLYIKIE